MNIPVVCDVCVCDGDLLSVLAHGSMRTFASYITRLLSSNKSQAICIRHIATEIPFPWIISKLFSPLMRNKLIDPQFSTPLTNVLTRGSVATTSPYDAALRVLKHFRESLYRTQLP